nr:MAG TPA: hypothetical protein [Caudoviricetes sp.]
MIMIRRLELYIATARSHTRVLRSLYQVLWICI